MAPPKGLKDTFSTKKIGSRVGKAVIGGGAVVLAFGHFPGFDDAGLMLPAGIALYEWTLVLVAAASGFWKEGE